jgi:hypothetical protein
MLQQRKLLEVAELFEEGSTKHIQETTLKESQEQEEADITAYRCTRKHVEELDIYYPYNSIDGPRVMQWSMLHYSICSPQW